MEQGSSKPQPITLLELSSALLSYRDFSGSLKYALMARESDPDLPGTNEIITIANVLLSADHRLTGNHIDYYSILQVSPSDSDVKTVVRKQFRKLAVLLCPSKNSFPFCQEALNLVLEAWSTLSSLEKKSRYDAEISKCNAEKLADQDQPEAKEKAKAESPPDSSFRFGSEEVTDQMRKESSGNESGTFWTVCPYCYWLHEYDKMYADYCMRCSNCRKAFQGMAVPPLPEGAKVKGREAYYCALGYFQVEYSSDGSVNDKKSNGDKGFNMDDVVEISDSDDSDANDDADGGGAGGGDIEKRLGVKSEKSKEETNRFCKEAKDEVVIMKIEGKVEETGGVVSGKHKGKRVKSVARNSKKIMGRGIKSRRIKPMSLDILQEEDFHMECEIGYNSDI